MPNSIRFDVNFQVDKSGLNEIQKSLEAAAKEAESMNMDHFDDELNSVAMKMRDLSALLGTSWNSTLNQLDLSRINNEITKAYGSMSNLKSIMESSGPAGAAAYNQVASAILSTNLQIREGSKLLNDMATTMGNTIKWGIASSAMNTLSGSIQSAWGFAQRLDTSLNNIRIVTSKSAEDMAEFAVQANNAAKALGASTTDYTNASLIYYQQGLSDEEVQARTDVTLKTANVTGQAAREVSEELTAVWNGYQRTSEEAESSIDMLAAVAANTASNLEELATGMSTVASAANAMGVSEEQLTAQLSTIISATRQGPEMTGRALRTIYARMSTINAGGIDEEDGATLTSYTAKMDKFGISVLDVNGKLRDMGDVIEEIGGKWDTFTREQQVAISQAMAGTRQYNNIMALFENWDAYERALDIAKNSVGTLQEQQDIYMESTAAHLQQLSTTAESAYNTIFDMQTINKMIDGVTTVISVLSNFLSSLGGGMNTLAMLGVMGVNVFSQQIGGAIERQIENTEILKQNFQALSLVQQTAQAGAAVSGEDVNTANAYQQQAERASELLNLVGSISNEEYNRLTNISTQIKDYDLLISKSAEMRDNVIANNISEQELQNTQVKESAVLQGKTVALNQQKKIYNELLLASQQIGSQETLNQNYSELSTASKEKILQFEQQFVQALNQELISTEQKNAWYQLEQDYCNNRLTTEEFIAEILKLQVNELGQAQVGYDQQKATVEAIKAILSGNTDEIIRQRAALDGLFKTGVNNNSRQKGITDTTKALSALTIGISSVSNAIKVLHNDDLSAWEKFSQIASNLVFTAPMLLSTLASLLPSIAVSLSVVGSTAEAATMGIGKLTASVATAEVTIGSLTAPLWGVVTAAALAAAGLVSFGMAVYDTYTAQARAAENAAKAASTLREENDQVAQSAVNFQNLIDAYETAYDKIGDCTAGTQEWKGAIEDANDAALDLINTLSNLSGDEIRNLYSTDANTGLITFDTQQLEQYSGLYKSMANISELGAAVGEFQASMASIRADLSTATNNFNANALGEYGTGTLYDMIEPIMDQFFALGDDADAVGAKLEDLGITSDRLGEEYFNGLVQAIIELGNQADAAAAKLRLIAEVEMSEMLGEGVEQVVRTMSGNAFINANTRATNQAETDIRNAGKNSSRSANADLYQSILDALQASGRNYTGVGNGTTAFKGSADDRTVAFVDEAGKIIDLDATYLASLVGAYQATEQLPEITDQATQAFDNLSEHGISAADKAIIDFINNGNLENLTQEEANKFGEALSGGVDEVLQHLFKMSPEEYEDLLPDNFDKGINEALETVDSGFVELNSELQKLFGENLFKGVDLSDLSLNTQKVLADALTDSLSGIEGLDVFNQLKLAFANLNADGLKSVTQAIGALNEEGAWGSVTIGQWKNALTDAGLEINEDVSKSLAVILAALNTASQASQDFGTNFENLYASIHDSIDSLSNGAKLSESDFVELQENLAQIGVPIEDFFDKTLNGEYKLTAAAEDFQQAAEEALMKQFDQVIQNEQNRQNQLQNVQTIGYENLSAGNYTPTTEGESPKYNTEVVEAQLYAIEALNLADEETLANWKAQEAEGLILTEDLDAITQTIIDNKDAFEQLDDEMATSVENIEEWRERLAASADSLGQLQQYLDAGRISQEQYNEAAQKMWEGNRTADLNTKDLENYTNYLYDLAKAEFEASDAAKTMSKEDTQNYLANLQKTCKQTAIEVMNMNDSITDLSKNIDTWSKALKNSKSPAQDVSEAIAGLNKDLQKMLDTSYDFGKNGGQFLVDNLEDIEKAATGDEEAIDRLRDACLQQMILDFDISDTSFESTEEFESAIYDLKEQLDALTEEDWSINPTLDVDGLYEGEADLVAACQAIVDEAHMTTDQANAFFSNMGYDVQMATDEEPQDMVIPNYETKAEVKKTGSTPVTIGATADGEPQTVEVEGYEIVTETKQKDPTTVEGIATAIAMQTGEPGSGGGTPQITSVSKKPGGAANNKSKTNGGGKKSGGGGGGGKKGGGGGGGGGSGTAQEPKVEEHIEDQADRYHDVNVRLQEISTSLSRLQGQESKLLGSNLINNLNRQLELLNQEIDTTTQKIAIAEDEATEYRDKLAEQGVLFDANGDVANYFDIMQSQLDYVNATIDSYNAMSAEEQEAYQETLDAVKEAYNQFVEDMSRYEEIIHDEIPSYYDDIQSDFDEQIQINIQKFTAEIEVRLDMREAEKDWNEFYRKVVLGLSSDDIFGNVLQDMADVISYFDTTATDVFHRRGNDIEDWVDAIEDAMSGYSDNGTLQKLSEQIEDTIDQLETIEGGGMASVYGDNEVQALEDLQTYYTELMNELEDIYDLVDDIKDEYLDMIDEAIDKFDQQVDQYEYINDLLNHDVELIGLLYGDDAYAEMARYYQQIEDNNNQELDFLRQRVDFAYEMMQAETDDDAREKWQEEWEDALSELNDKVENSVQNIIDKYCNAIAQIIDELNDAVTNGLGLEYVSDEWDLMNQEADIYLDKINETYAIQDIRNKYLDAIDATDSLYAQQKLNEAMEMELSYLEEKDNLTQSDVDRAELLYEITLKQIALDEAQQNKSTMRLRRDSQGNYTYQYVSDQDETAQLQQELLDLQNQLYNFDLDAYKENLDDLYSVYEEFQERLLELYQDQTLSAEEREQQIALYVEYYGNIINDLVTENTYLRMNLEQSAVEELATLYDTDVENFRNMSEEEIDELMNNLVPQWDSGIQHMADTFAGEGGFIPTCTEAFEELDQATLDYQDSLDTLEATAGVDFASIATGYDTNIQLAQDLLAGNEELIQSYKDMIIVLQTLIEELADFLEMSDMDYYIRQAANGYNYYQEMEENMRDAYANQDYSTPTVVATFPTEEETEEPMAQVSEYPTVTGTGNGVLEVGDTATYTGGLYYSDSYGATPTGSRGAGGTVTITQIYSDGRPYPIHVTSENSAYGWLTQSQLSGYDTGGYTGEWGSSGALALLHQKELVLNPTDTENILDAVSLVRDISTLLDKLDTSVINRVMTMKEEMLSGTTGKFENGNPEIDQRVEITANFPNVRDSQEIEDALNNLVNYSSQFAFRSA